eukprot:TRINITY_DN136405_c0_g1_i1.p1 TRINITY_DN136405_c0_g1~~TRINITY_DN136405_c0_g1_i1.p1  ORF type:complete len:113 (+),score=88.21 TRINITY_DN136405_c0_g1_i1:101-439(+)
MKVVAAYLLAVLGGNANPDAAAINKILGSVGIEADAARVEKLVNELKGKNIQEVIAEGSKKLATLPAAGSAAPAPAASSAPAGKQEEKKEDKKKKEEPKEEEDEDMGFGLFD